MKIIWVVLAIFIVLPIWIAFYYSARDLLSEFLQVSKFKPNFWQKFFLIIFSPIFLFMFWLYCLVRLILSSVIRIY